MPYTTEQIAAQQKVVDKLKEDIKWKEGVSYDFQGIDEAVPVWNGTRADYWANWRTENPDIIGGVATVNGDGTITYGYDQFDESTNPHVRTHTVMWDYWKWEMEYDEGYEVDTSGNWATYITDKKSQLSTEEATLATMQADPA